MDDELFLTITKLMGWKLHLAIEKRPYDIWEDPEGVFGGEPPSWTEDWAASGLVAEKMIAADYSFGVSWYPRDDGKWYAEFHQEEEIWEEFGDTGPHAICLAAKAAKEG